jgi:hypothetical protein
VISWSTVLCFWTVLLFSLHVLLLRVFIHTGQNQYKKTHVASGQIDVIILYLVWGPGRVAPAVFLNYKPCWLPHVVRVFFRNNQTPYCLILRSILVFK